MDSKDRLDKAQSRWREWMNSEEYKQRLSERLRVLDATENSSEAKQLAFGICSRDPIKFIELFGWVFDPRPEYYPNHLPLILFDYQKDTILWLINKIKNGEDGLLEKSRDMGATWLFIWVFIWYWRFAESFSGLLGSYKQDLVDNRTLDSHFGKIDYCIQQLPKWLLPSRFSLDKHRQSMKLVNPENGNLITGDTMNPDFARGSRKTAVFLDEGASWEYFTEAWASSGDTTPCRLTASTPKGHNAFALLRDSGIDVKTLHWKLHPLKDQEWYDYEKSRRSDEEVAQELDISYNKSQEGRVYPEFDNCEWGTFKYDPFKPLYESWDFGKTDDTAMLWFQQQDDGRIALIDSYSNRGKTIDFYIPFVTGVAPSQSIGYTKKDYAIIESHKNWHNAVHFGDPAVRFGNQVTDKTVLSVLQDNGIRINFLEDSKDFSSRRNSTKVFLRNMVLDTNENNKLFAIAIENASYPKMRTGGGEEIRSIAPKHDWTSHFRSSLEYMAVNYLNRRHSRQVKDKFSKQNNEKRTIAY
jgi:hypothetical protein